MAPMCSFSTLPVADLLRKRRTALGFGMNLKYIALFCLLTCCLPTSILTTLLVEHDMEVEGEQIVKEADGEDAVVEGDVVEELPKEAETIPRHATGHLIQPPATSVSKRNAIKPTRWNRWPNNIMSYEIDMDPPMSPTEHKNFNIALDQYAKHTCIQLVNSDDAEYRLRIFRGRGCYSAKGRTWRGRQPQWLSLGKGCLWDPMRPMHEMMHALGGKHAQNRPDRDDYVYIDFDNVKPSHRGQYRKQTYDNTALYGTEYSYESVMHYGAKDFALARSKKVITTYDAAKQKMIGKARHFSFEDLQTLNRMYPCDCGDDAPVCAGHSYLGPDCKCQCKQDDLSPAPCDPCYEAGIACECQESGCGTVPRSTCSQDTNACECDNGFVKIGSECVPSSTIKCLAVGINCHCSLNDPAACNDYDENSVCNTETDRCECTTGYELQGRVCVDVTTLPCKDLNEPCYCSQKDVGECRSNVNPHSGCDVVTDSCVCLGGYVQKNGNCELDTDPGYKSDGEFLTPFTKSKMSTIPFAPQSTKDKSDATGNSWQLHVKSSRIEDVAAFETETIALKGDWCVSLGFRLNSAKLSVGYSIGGGEWQWRGWEDEEYATYFVKEEFRVHNPSTIKFQVVAEEYNMALMESKYWRVFIDPIIIVPCDEN